MRLLLPALACLAFIGVEVRAQVLSVGDSASELLDARVVVPLDANDEGASRFSAGGRDQQKNICGNKKCGPKTLWCGNAQCTGICPMGHGSTLSQVDLMPLNPAQICHESGKSARRGASNSL